MSAIEVSTNSKVRQASSIIVSDADDEEVRDFMAAMEHAGLHVLRASDVYAATAMLAGGLLVNRVIVDTRTLDDKETAFLRLVPRFFPRCEVVVPLFAGTVDRSVFHAAGVQPTSIAAALEATIAKCLADRAPSGTASEPMAGGDLVDSEAEDAGRPAQPEDEEPAEPSGRLDEAGGEDSQTTDGIVSGEEVSRLSTDGGPEASEQGPSMHEAVRKRMFGGGRGVIRRTPPRNPPDSQAPRPPQQEAEDSVTKAPVRPGEPMLSPEELDALLRDDEGETAQAG